MFSRSRTPSPEPSLTPLPPPPVPRRLVVVVVGLKPHRHLWSTSARPGESVMYYQLLNGCPSLVVPARIGAPLVGWDGLTLEQLWAVPLPKDDVTTEKDSKFKGVVGVLYEFMSLCVDWTRVVVPGGNGDESEEGNKQRKEGALRAALTLIVAGAVRSGDSKTVRDEVDKERSGIAIWRIP
eukprot:GHVO01003275.1.p1 GENE.GHVO01003275.1~~GHVO01003275.1.p1  ORF type:complete len:181 (+),score=8.76 GHVO01003275.1:684-1226(+)